MGAVEFGGIEAGVVAGVAPLVEFAGIEDGIVAASSAEAHFDLE